MVKREAFPRVMNEPKIRSMTIKTRRSSAWTDEMLVAYSLIVVVGVEFMVNFFTFLSQFFFVGKTSLT